MGELKILTHSSAERLFFFFQNFLKSVDGSEDNFKLLNKTSLFNIFY